MSALTIERTGYQLGSIEVTSGNPPEKELDFEEILRDLEPSKNRIVLLGVDRETNLGNFETADQTSPGEPHETLDVALARAAKQLKAFVDYYRPSGTFDVAEYNLQWKQGKVNAYHVAVLPGTASENPIKPQRLMTVRPGFGSKRMFPHSDLYNLETCSSSGQTPFHYAVCSFDRDSIPGISGGGDERLEEYLKETIIRVLTPFTQDSSDLGVVADELLDAVEPGLLLSPMFTEYVHDPDAAAVIDAVIQGEAIDEKALLDATKKSYPNRPDFSKPIDVSDTYAQAKAILEKHNIAELHILAEYIVEYIIGLRGINDEMDQMAQAQSVLMSTGRMGSPLATIEMKRGDTPKGDLFEYLTERLEEAPDSYHLVHDGILLPQHHKLSVVGPFSRLYNMLIRPRPSTEIGDYLK